MDTLFGWLLLASLLSCAVAKETEVRAYVDTSATLTCRVDTDQCGTLHSVKWYRDTSRIYVLTQTGQIARGEEDVTKRMNVTYNETEKQTSLKINPVDIDDESTYKCEITYIEVRENCDVVQIVKLTTLVKPDAAHIYGYDGKEVEKFGKLEAKDEGAEVSLTCSAEGKPIPTISWYNDSQLMNRASYSTNLTNSSGRGMGISKLQLILSKGDLNAKYECKVESQALEEPMVSWVTVDVKVAPTRVVLSGSESAVKQGDKVTLTCMVYGAQPEATIWWTNGTTNVTNDSGGYSVIETRSEKAEDGTNTTISSLIFTASRWENDQYFKCYAMNEVMLRKGNPPLYETLILDVRFPPVITVKASATTLNETDDVFLTCHYYANPQKLLDATWLKDGIEFPRKEGKHLHGDINQPSLTIKKISREDMGEYTCKLGNEVAETKSEPIFLDVLYPPEVEVVMDPPGPVKERDQKNVTLYCNVTTGNPSWLRKVRWFLDDSLIADLPECNESQSEVNGSLGGKFCGIDPSILSLINVDQNFAGNYTCQGENDAGRYGRVSEPQELIVYYPPSKAKLRHYPSTVIKKGSVTLECMVDNPGRPENLTYVWYRGSHLVHNSSDHKWTIHQVSLETRNNFTCYAVNEGGWGEGGTDEIRVLAPPAFIGNLNSYKGVLYSANNISLTCRIECYPLCSIIWFKDGHRLDTSNNPLYSVKNKEYGPDYNKNDFESIESTLIWNMENWPNRQLNKSAPHSHYTCASISKETQRPNVTFTTEIAVDFPPEDLVVSEKVINVTEYEIPASVKCSGKGRPKLSYIWRRNSTLEPIGKDDTLQLDKMSRSAAGYYTCEAYNKYGKDSINVYFDVHYKPECSVKIGDVDGKQALICRAEANPKNVTYVWTVQENNETTEYTDAVYKGDFSYIELDPTVTSERIYRCIANNAIGDSEACPQKIPGNSRAAWYLDRHNLIVLVASIIALIICVIVVCIVIIVLCRKKRQNAKSPNPSSTGDKMRLGVAPPVGGSADPANDHDKAFYENLPFHGMQNPPNKPISVIAPFTQETNPITFTPSAKPLIPTAPTAFAPCNKIIQRHQSFHGFQNNQQMHALTNFQARFNFGRNLSNPYLNSWNNNVWMNWPNFQNRNFRPRNTANQQVTQPFRFSQSQNNFQPILNFNPFLLPNPFSIPPQTIRVPGRREADVRRTASGINIAENERPKDEKPVEKAKSTDDDKRFGSLELKKHKCYSPTFYSMRCKKHAKKRPVVYALPKKVFGDLKATAGDAKSENYQSLTDSIQIYEQNCENDAKEPSESVPVPAPRCKKHPKSEIIYQNVSQEVKNRKNLNGDVSNSSNDGSENLESEISVIEAQIHNSKDERNQSDESRNETNIPRSPPKLVGVSPKSNVSLDRSSNLIKVEAMKALKNSPMLKVSPNFIKPKTESPKGALSLQIQAKLKNSSDNLSQSEDSGKENLPLIPQMPLLNPQSKWSPGLANPNQNAFYTLTTPHYKHMNVGLPPQYSATIPHQKHTKLIPRALFNEQLPKSKSFSSKPKHKKHFQIPLQKCHSFKFQTAESYFQPIKNIHEEDLMKNGYVSDYPESSRGRHHKREKPKQKTKGPLVLRRPNDFHENVQFPENVQNSVQLQYPQPIIGSRSLQKPNGVVYADLDMPKTNNKKSSHETSSAQSKSQKSKPKTEYATLTFNDIGQEIDV